MNKPSAKLVGIFVLGAMALIAAAIVFFGGGSLFKQRVPIVSYFSGSVAGLSVGAPVTYRGVHVGMVKSIGLRLFPDNTNTIVQVDMELLPETVKTYGPQLGSLRDQLPGLVARGLSAQLVLESLVTGQLLVELDFRPGVKARRLGTSSDSIEIPTVPKPFQAVTHQLESIDLAGTVASLDRTLASAQALLANPRLSKTLDELPALMADLRSTLHTVQREVSSTSATGRHALASVQSLSQTLEREASGTLVATRTAAQSANTAMEGANMLLDPDGETVAQLQRAIEDLAETAARLRSVAERVDRDPAVLVRGR